MPLPEALLAKVREFGRSPRDWFSIEEIKGRDPELEVAARYIQKTTGKELIVPRDKKQLYQRLEDWAARLLEHEVRSYEQKISELCSENSFVPTAEDDVILRDEMTRYIKTSAEQPKDEISRVTQYNPDKWYDSWSKLDRTVERLSAEMSVTMLLAGEIARLEMLDSGYEPVDRIGYAQVKIERFFSMNYSKIPHPFDNNNSLSLPSELLKRAIRLITHVVFRKIEEPRLQGFEKKFVNVFLRYLSCSRESSGAVVEQVTALFEPFLKKLSFIFKICDAKGNPVWTLGLEGLIPGLGLSPSDLKKSDHAYWQARSCEDGVLRVAYQLRHKGAHEAHEYAYYELERHAYFVFAALVVSGKILTEANPEVAKIVDHQGDVDAVRDLFVRIEELAVGPDGPRESSRAGVPPSRLRKLLGFSSRAQAVWPNCSADLRSLLESEYASVKSELTDADREADIEAYLDSMRGDEY